MKERLYYLVYKTINIVNSKIYIGVHGTNDINDNYLGSGVHLRRAIKKYGKVNFVKEVIQMFQSYKEALEYERLLVTKEFCLRHDNYNQEIGGKGGKIWTDEEK